MSDESNLLGLYQNLKQIDKKAKFNKEELLKIREYERGVPNATGKKQITNKKLRNTLLTQEKNFTSAAVSAARSEILLTEQRGFLETDGTEKAYQISQKKILDEVDLQTKKKAIDLKLPYGPYHTRYQNNGQSYCIGGEKGHIAIINAHHNTLTTEFNVKETVNDLTFLHDSTVLAVGQKKRVYIYDHQGIELHSLEMPSKFLQFLKYFFILTCTDDSGEIVYLDTSTGQIISKNHSKRNGKCLFMCQNPYNSVIHTSYSNGTVCLFSPNQSSFLAKILCHKSPVHSVAVNRDGNIMATSGADSLLKIWDLRTYNCLNSISLLHPAQYLDISQTGIIGVAQGPHITTYKDYSVSKSGKTNTYLKHTLGGNVITDLHFRPFEDVMLAGHRKGVMGGESNIDTYEENPYENPVQRRENTVQKLLDKLDPSMIVLDPTRLCTIREPPHAVAPKRSRVIQ